MVRSFVHCKVHYTESYLNKTREAAYFFVIERTYMYIVTEEIKYTTSNGKILLSL